MDAFLPLYRAVRDVPDFPKPGILFKDIMPLLADAACFRLAIDGFAEICRALPGGPPTKIVGIDARGFSSARRWRTRWAWAWCPCARRASCPARRNFTPTRSNTARPSWRCRPTRSKPGERVVVVDDLLATGGTAAAALELIKKLGGEPLAVLFLIELEFLRRPRSKLSAAPVTALLKY